MLTFGVSYAQETPKAEFDENIFPIIEDEFTVEETENNDRVSVKKAPTCDDERFHEETLKRVKLYILSGTNNSIKSKRKNALMLANIKEFEPVLAKDITPNIDFNTASAIISLKINKYIKESDFVICRQKGIRDKPLYLLAYPYSDTYMVHIINLDMYSDDYEKISFTYP